MQFDSTISLGNIITTVIFLLGGFRIYNVITIDIDRLKFKVDDMWDWRKSNFTDRNYSSEHNQEATKPR